MSKYSNKKPFTATLKWLEVVQRFYAEMPLNSHRHNLRYFSETFMASKAVDFLCNLLPSVFEKECSRESALKVLGLFLRDGLIENVIRQDDSRVYDNSALYRFCDGKIKQYIENKGGKVTRRVKRTSSLQSENGRIKWNSRNRERGNSEFAIDFKSDLAKRDPECLAHSGRVSMSCNDLSLVEPAKPSSSFFVQSAQVARKGVKTICDTVLRSTENVKNSSLISLRGGTPKKNLVKSLSQQQDTPILSRNSVTTRMPITDVDEYRIWRHCLIERFKQAAGIMDENLIFKHCFNGANVRWNCKMRNEQNFVDKRPETKKEFPTSLVENLKRLSTWGLDNLSKPQGLCSNDKSIKTEPQIFVEVIDALSPFCPFIPGDVAETMMRVFLHMRSLSCNPPSPNEQFTPTNDKLFLLISIDKRSKFVLLMQLCLLTLDPLEERKLQILLRYIRRMLKNTNLRLDGRNSNKSYVVKQLSPLFIEPKNSFTDRESTMFFWFLVENLDELLFKIPKFLESDVRVKEDNLLSGKDILTANGEIVPSRSSESVYKRKLRTSSTPPRLERTYCDQIDKNTYELQLHEMDKELLKLLNNTIADKNMCAEKKAAFIKDFRTTYPRIYEIRFPDNK